MPVRVSMLAQQPPLARKVATVIPDKRAVAATAGIVGRGGRGDRKASTKDNDGADSKHLSTHKSNPSQRKSARMMEDVMTRPASVLSSAPTGMRATAVQHPIIIEVAI